MAFIHLSVPTQKMPRSLNTSASACKKLMVKTELMGIDAKALEFQEQQVISISSMTGHDMLY